MPCGRTRSRLLREIEWHAQRLSADFLDYLPEMNQGGLILPKIHLKPLAIGVLDDGFDRRLYDPAGMQIDLNAVADSVACLWDAFFLLLGIAPESIMSLPHLHYPMKS